MAKISFEAMANGPPVGKPVQATIRSGSDKNLKTAVDSIVERTQLN